MTTDLDWGKMSLSRLPGFRFSESQYFPSLGKSELEKLTETHFPSVQLGDHDTVISIYIFRKTYNYILYIYKIYI